MSSFTKTLEEWAKQVVPAPPEAKKLHEPPEARPVRPPIPTDLPGVGLRVAVAMHPGDHGNSAGSAHYTVTAELRVGQLHRLPGEALCRRGTRPGQPRPKSRPKWAGSSGFWGLLDKHDECREANCARCLVIGAKLGIKSPIAG